MDLFNLVVEKEQFFYGRENEMSRLTKLFDESEGRSYVVGVPGVRRSGKTMFIKEFIRRQSDVLKIELTGSYKLNSKENAKNAFIKTSEIASSFFGKEINLMDIAKKYPEIYQENPWSLYFQSLASLIEGTPCILFFDEVAWFDKSENFINAFAYFWNNFGSTTKNLFVLLDCSSNSWINSNIFKDTKELYNRVIKLEIKPFSFSEIQQLFKEKGWAQQEVLLYYFMFGGFIKYYLEAELNLKSSFEENIPNINRLYPFLASEYDAMFRGVFNEKRLHKPIIDFINLKKSATIKDIHKELSKKYGVTYETVRVHVNELEDCQFIKSYGKKQKSYYNNIPLSYFYHFWIKKSLPLNKKDAFYVWQGICFENFVLTNLDKLNIEGGISFNRQVTYKEWLSSLSIERLINAKAKLLEEKGENFRSQIMAQYDLLIENKHQIIIIEAKLKNGSLTPEDKRRILARECILKDITGKSVKTMVVGVNDLPNQLNFLTLFNQ